MEIIHNISLLRNVSIDFLIPYVLFGKCDW